MIKNMSDIILGTDIIKKYFNSLNDTQLGQFEKIGTLYPEWNDKINVISRQDIENLYPNHILHSLSIAKFFNPVAGTTFLDMGTGGGFPGIPLAIMFPDCKFHLIDRIGKKIKVAQSIAEEIGLYNVTFQHGDIGECRSKFDFVISRAVMRLDSLLPLIKKNISPSNKNSIPNGLICLKGGDLKEELDSTSSKLRIKRNSILAEDLSKYFEEDFYNTKKIIYVSFMDF